MKAMFKNKLLAASALAIALFTSYSCSDSDIVIDDVYQFPEPEDSELTALKVMQKDGDFADFLSVVDLCGEECADSLFNQERVYTIFAPVNGSFPISEIQSRIERGDREGVFREFVKSYVVNFKHAANGELDKELLMLNNKYVKFAGNATDGYTFGEREIIDKNILTKNAIIHKISSAVDYRPSLWEALKNVSSISDFWDFCASYTVREFDAGNSTPGDIINQEQTYLDSAFKESNVIRNRLGSVDNEDSLIVMYAPTSELWNEIYETSASFFNYDMENFTEKQQHEADSIKYIRGIMLYLDRLTYSLTDQRVNGEIPGFDNLPDSLVVRQQGYPRKKYARAEFNEVESYPMSNGVLTVVDAMPVNPFNLWVDTIKLEPDYKSGDVFRYIRKDTAKNGAISNIFTTKNVMYTREDVSKVKQNPDVVGKLSNGSYFFAQQPTKTNVTDLPRVKFFVEKVYSTCYKIAIITPPWFIESYEDTLVTKTGPQYNDTYLRVRVSQKGKEIAVIPSEEFDVTVSRNQLVPADKAVRVSKERLDTTFLKDAEGNDYIFKFDYCEEYSNLTELGEIGEEDYTVEIDFEVLQPAQQNKNGKYAKMNSNDIGFRLMLDQIMLIPVNPEENNTGSGTDTDTDTDTDTEAGN